MIAKEKSEAPCFRISGRVRETCRFHLSQLLAMETVEFNDLLMACGSGEPKGRINSCRGILLTDIINMAGVITSDHNDTKKMYVVASSDDGYTKLFSWQEVVIATVGEGVIVLLEKDGQRVYEDFGRVDLFSTGDFLSGARYVKRLFDLRILMIE